MVGRQENKNTYWDYDMIDPSCLNVTPYSNLINMIVKNQLCGHLVVIDKWRFCYKWSDNWGCKDDNNLEKENSDSFGCQILCNKGGKLMSPLQLALLQNFIFKAH